jgi:uncharacterized DUF497 family protein
MLPYKSMVVSFDWDEEKNIRNQEKHGVGFEQAQRKEVV